MGTESDHVPLEALCDTDRGITYGIVKVGDYISDGVPVIRGGDIRDNRITVDLNKRVTPAVSRDFRRTILRGGEIVMNLIAEPGHSAIVPPSLAGANVSRDVAVIPVASSADPRFVNYFLQSPHCVTWLRSHLQGSVTLKINLGTLARLPVPLLDIDEQRAIAALLGALDEKVALNYAMTETLEQILMKHVALASSEAPEVSIATLAEYVNGGALTRHANGRGMPILRIRELNGDITEDTPRSDVTVPSTQRVAAGDLLFSWSGSLDVYRWHGPDALLNQHIFKVVPRDGYPQWAVYYALRLVMPQFQAI